MSKRKNETASEVPGNYEKLLGDADPLKGLTPNIVHVSVTEVEKWELSISKRILLRK